ncbi:MobP3 family relaxase, partial [Ruminococcus bicirculans (ex Wegman et al. 2014)]|uniref:MobP3 family relaxase n=1 Tax=Ruminococcus bicirculans (ex Wegman et al. 2014) TaxID=1160721 RepID=UPI003A93A1C8
MPKLIVTSRYLKSGSKKNLENYVKYIATREGSVPITRITGQAPATKNQQELISSLLNDFPDSKELFEYTDYIKNPTVKNGFILISEILDRNMDRLTSRENYVGYLANRPGAVKFGSHGLFSQSDEPIDLDKVAKEIADHGGNVWTHVVSLRRDNAQAMGYDNIKAWRELVKRQVPNIAKQQKIDMANLKWYAAFHDKKTNPHVHIIVYSTNEREGFLTNHGIEKIRSGFANDIYSEELHHLYSQQTDLRSLLKEDSKTLMKSPAEGLKYDNCGDDELCKLIFQLHSQLKSSKGKKVYGYMKTDVKKTVDDIFSKLADNESIKKMYELWCEMEQQKHDVYSSAKLKFPPLVDNKEFRSVRNMIIRTVLNMKLFDANTEIEGSEPNDEYFDNTPQSMSPLFDEAEPLAEKETDESAAAIKYYIKWADQYKKACKLIYGKDAKLNDFKKAEQLLLSESQCGNVLAVYDLGKLYSTDKLGEKSEEISIAKYTQALQGFLQIEPNSKKLKPYVQYRIGKMFCYGLGTEQNYQKAFEWFERSAKQKNKFAQFSLANLYYYGSGIEKDLSQAFLWYQRSSSQGQPYAAYSIAQMYRYGEYVTKDNDTAQRYYKQALSGFLKIESDDMANDDLFYKLGQMFNLGLGTDSDVTKAIKYFKRSAEMNNKNGLFEYGKALLIGEHIPQDTDSTVKLLEKAVKLKNSNAKRFLALEYISGE